MSKNIKIDPIEGVATVKAASEKSARNILGPYLKKSTHVKGWFLLKDWDNFFDEENGTFRFNIRHIIMTKEQSAPYLELAS